MSCAWSALLPATGSACTGPCCECDASMQIAHTSSAAARGHTHAVQGHRAGHKTPASRCAIACLLARAVVGGADASAPRPMKTRFISLGGAAPAPVMPAASAASSAAVTLMSHRFTRHSSAAAMCASLAAWPAISQACVEQAWRAAGLSCGGESEQHLLLIRRERLQVGRFADDGLDLVAAARILQVARKRPLAHAPVLYGADAAVAAVALHRRIAPVRLSSHLTEVAAGAARHVDAHMVRSGVIVPVYAVPIAGEAGQSHACAGAAGERTAIDVEVRVLPSEVRGKEEHTYVDGQYIARSESSEEKDCGRGRRSEDCGRGTEVGNSRARNLFSPTSFQRRLSRCSYAVRSVHAHHR